MKADGGIMKKIFVNIGKYILVVLLYCMALIAMYYFVFVVIFGDADKCFDNGGVWDEERSVCLH
jgi:hypothetical protein